MAPLGSTWLHLAPRGSTWLTKLGRCDSYTMEWLNNRTAKNSSSIARIHLAPSTWLHLAAHGSTWFLHVSTDSLPTSTDPLLTLYWTASDLPCVWTIENSWEHSKLHDVWIGLDHRPPLQLEHRWAVLIIKPFWNPKNICVTTFLGHCNNKYLNFTFLQHFTKLLQPIHIVTSFIRCNNIVTTIICCNDIVT